MSRRRLSLDKLSLCASIQSQEQSLKGKGSSSDSDGQNQPGCITASTASAACYTHMVVARSGQRNSVEECHQLDDLSHNLRLIGADAVYCGLREPSVASWPVHYSPEGEPATSWRNHASERSWLAAQNQRSPACAVNQPRHTTSI